MVEMGLLERPVNNSSPGAEAAESKGVKQELAVCSTALRVRAMRSVSGFEGRDCVREVRTNDRDEQRWANTTPAVLEREVG